MAYEFDSISIKAGNSKKITAWADGPGYVVVDQGKQEIMMNAAQAIALADFIQANRTALIEARERHGRGY
jgi:hypothetical protein